MHLKWEEARRRNAGWCSACFQCLNTSNLQKALERVGLGAARSYASIVGNFRQGIEERPISCLGRCTECVLQPGWPQRTLECEAQNPSATGLSMSDPPLARSSGFPRPSIYVAQASKLNPYVADGSALPLAW